MSNGSLQPDVEEIRQVGILKRVVIGRINDYGVEIRIRKRKRLCVTSTDIGGLAELVGDVGLKFPLGDAESLAGCMLRVIKESRLAQALGEKAKQRAQTFFREERMVAEHLAVYRQLLGESSRPTA